MKYKLKNVMEDLLINLLNKMLIKGEVYNEGIFS